MPGSIRRIAATRARKLHNLRCRRRVGAACFSLRRAKASCPHEGGSRTIEIDAETAEALEARAAERGTSVSQVVAELVDIEREPGAVGPAEIAELDHRWAAVEAGGGTVPHEKVVRWLQTWGTPAFRPWRER